MIARAAKSTAARSATLSWRTPTRWRPNCWPMRAIVLSKKQVAHIFEVLDHPPAKSVAAVRKLLTERSILDG